MKLFLTRHGETVENVTGIIQGHLPGQLSQKGYKQAKKLAARLKYIKFDVIYSSDLKRASDTAKEILKFHKKTPFYLTKNLRERNLGKYQGMKNCEISWGEVNEGIETFNEMRERANSFLNQVYQKHFGQTVLFVAHGGINCQLLSIVSGEKSKLIFDTKHPKNTSIYIIDFDENSKGRIILNNCTEHLPKKLN
jgi:broad specificity phosphatase PhoE